MYTMSTSTSTSKVRYPNQSKPRTSLQRLQSLANWNIHFMIKTLDSSNLSGFIMTDELKEALIEQRDANYNLRCAIGNSYQITRMHILRERKKRQS